MPSITVDGHSFSIDGRRIWLVSGTVSYTQIPRSEWAGRLHAAKQAGLNCVEVPVVWSAHEPRPSKFSFDADLDVAAFLKLAHSLDLLAIVRAGPYVGEGLDLGGLPAWLVAETGGKLRTHAPEYLQFVSRFISELCERIAALQVTGGPNRRGKGPIIAVQAEHRWLCGEDGRVSGGTITGGVPKEGTDYLNELQRFLREGGINVPLLAANDLYHAAEGQVEAWCGRAHLHANLRQLRLQRPDYPRLVMSQSGVNDHDGLDAWGGPERPGLDVPGMVRALSESLAGGAQFNVSSFAPGLRAGFNAGRATDAPDHFLTPAPSNACITPGGGRTALYNAVKRVATFASTFDRVLCALDPAFQPVTIATDMVRADASSKERAHPYSLIHCQGAQGSVVFVFASSSAQGEAIKIVLPDGSTLPVFPGEQGAAWVLLNTHLGGRSTLDYCNVCAFAVVGKSLVLYGQAGTPALLSINGAALELMVPTDDKPLVHQMEDLTIALCNQRSIDQVIAATDCIWLGVRALDDNAQPIPAKGVAHIIRLGTGGDARTAPAKNHDAAPERVTLEAWSRAETSAYTDGSSPRFARIDRPAPMSLLGSPYGYSWLRLRFKSTSARKTRIGFFQTADRVQAWINGREAGVVGAAPGASSSSEPVSLQVSSGDNALSMLVDNLGRFCEGTMLGEPKGVFGELWEVDALKPAAPKLVTGERLEPLRIKSPIMGLQWEDSTGPQRITWKLSHRRSTPVFVVIETPSDDGVLAPGVLLLNDKPLGVFVPGVPVRLRLEADRFAKGVVSFQLAMMGDAQHALKQMAKCTRFFAGVANLGGEKGEWAFAKWEPPAASAYEASKKGAPQRARGPAWWRAHFKTPASQNGPGIPHPISLDTSGLSKGFILLNGRELTRYFTATGAGKRVGPRTKFLLPHAWMRPDGVNELLIFDEHGFAPTSCKIVAGE